MSSRSSGRARKAPAQFDPEAEASKPQFRHRKKSRKGAAPDADAAPPAAPPPTPAPPAKKKTREEERRDKREAKAAAAAAAAAVVPDPASYVGRKVRKDFPGFGQFNGTVMFYDSENKLFAVDFSDGDREILPLPVLLPLLTKARPKSARQGLKPGHEAFVEQPAGAKKAKKDMTRAERSKAERAKADVARAAAEMAAAEQAKVALSAVHAERERKVAQKAEKERAAAEKAAAEADAWNAKVRRDALKLPETATVAECVAAEAALNAAQDQAEKVRIAAIRATIEKARTERAAAAEAAQAERAAAMEVERAKREERAKAEAAGLLKRMIEEQKQREDEMTEQQRAGLVAAVLERLVTATVGDEFFEDSSESQAGGLKRPRETALDRSRTEQWTAAEDAELRLMVASEGVHHWAAKASRFSTFRSGSSMRHRWSALTEGFGPMVPSLAEQLAGGMFASQYGLSEEDVAAAMAEHAGSAEPERKMSKIEVSIYAQSVSR